jgi:hypothetical protein
MIFWCWPTETEKYNAYYETIRDVHFTQVSSNSNWMYNSKHRNPCSLRREATYIYKAQQHTALQSLFLSSKKAPDIFSFTHLVTTSDPRRCSSFAASKASSSKLKPEMVSKGGLSDDQVGLLH